MSLEAQDAVQLPAARLDFQAGSLQGAFDSLSQLPLLTPRAYHPLQQADQAGGRL